MNEQPVKTKTLKKVRRHFLNKTPTEEEQQEAQVAILQPVDAIPVQMIWTSIGIVERNRKFCVGIRFLNTHANLQNVKIENQGCSKAVTYNIELNEHIPQAPWEYYVKRLESFGDLNMASWAQKIKNHHVTYPKIMAQYLELARSDDPQIIANLRKAKNRAILAHRELESKYPYKRVTTFANAKRPVPISASYSERILNEMGHTPDSFVEWAKENGIPTLFGGESPMHADIAKAFLDCSVFRADPVRYGPEYVTYIYDKNKTKKKMVVQLVMVVEPAAEGMFVTGYAILKNLERPLDDKDSKVKSIKYSEESGEESGVEKMVG